MQASDPSPTVTMQPLTLPLRVYYEDTDAAGIVYYANYLRFIERGRTEFLRALGHDQNLLMKEGVAFAVRSVAAEYLKPARLDDQLMIETAITELGGAPMHPQTQGKIERWHQTLKNRILLENYFLPGDLEAQIQAFVEHYNHQRYHESLANVTPADAYFGRAAAIIKRRETIKRQTLEHRRLLHRKLAA